MSEGDTPEDAGRARPLSEQNPAPEPGPSGKPEWLEGVEIKKDPRVESEENQPESERSNVEDNT